MRRNFFPEKQGLYDPQFERDGCGVGFVCNINGADSHHIIRQGLETLRRLTHRGATGADPKTGDGAGILIQTPHKFFAGVCPKAGIDIPSPGEYGAGLIFLPTDRQERKFCKDVTFDVIKDEGQTLSGWRTVPVDNSDIGDTARDSEPVIEQIFIAKSRKINLPMDFERKLYIIRKRIENIIRASNLKQKSFFHITNLSMRTLIYKGLLTPSQVENFFPDLKDKNMKSAICLIHARYSTNTFPAWALAQPFRFLAHNGEINTLRGNINWMRAREGTLNSPVFGKDIKKIMPVIVPGGSDSAAIDNTFELLTLAGRSLPHTMMMLIPNAWENDNLMNEKLKGFYEYHSCLMEPWDGPAAIAFTDGTRVGAALDRNGLRPARYIVTKNGFVVMASEAGVLDIKPQDILSSGRLEPGKIFLVDTESERIISDNEIKETVSKRSPYNTWLREHITEIDKIPRAHDAQRKTGDIVTSLKTFGYTREDLRVIIKPMSEDGCEPTGSMGNDIPHAILSKKPQLFYNYFKQLFAQVTNPAIDPIREEIVMSLDTLLGAQKNILTESPSHCRKLRVKEPVLSNEDLAKIRSIDINGFKTKTIPILFEVSDKNNFTDALDRICGEAVSAIKEGFTFIILSDRETDKDYAALPCLLAAGTVHHHLVKNALRTRIGIILESGEPRETHHFALLFGYGADCVNPYLAYRTIEYLTNEGQLQGKAGPALENYRKALSKGILKILSKMGISTLQSYRGAQTFEALGLNQEIIDRCFTGTASRIGGAGLEEIAKETITRHREAYSEKIVKSPFLKAGGIYQWKRDGETHLWNPETIALLQDSARTGDYEKYKEFAHLINNQSENPVTLRSLFKFRKTNPIPISEVEETCEIVKRFVTGAMSFGSISRKTHETLAVAMNRLGGRSNTGEGGEDADRFPSLPDGNSLRSAIKQVASGRFGVTTNYLVNADELQIKIAQGAKPGEGGQLPGHKVNEIIAKTRCTTPGITLISPPPHHDIYSIEDLAQLIFDLKNVNPRARISVKLVSEAGVGTIAAGVAKGHADMILISGGDGGTGASPKSSIMHAGLPWELGLSETHQTLVLNDLRNRVRLQTDGQMRTGRDVAIAALLGAEEYGFGTSALVVLGCVMLRHCYLNTCSLGIATQEKALEEKFKGRPEYIINYLHFVARELRGIMASLGIRKVSGMIGKTDRLEQNYDVISRKAGRIDCSKILHKSDVPFGTHCTTGQNHGIGEVLDRRLIEIAMPALEKREAVKAELEIKNDDRAVGAMLSGEICRRYGEEALPPDTIHFKFKGTAGQSFGAWLAEGVTFELEGLANDYVGKGISGGVIILHPSEFADYKSEENIIAGNTCLYGAIAGEAYINGVVGERFCIRNSGLDCVVEGVGDHGCEYMTGGRIVVLGKTGRNFAAGMSGGIAYIYDEDSAFSHKCNMDMVRLEKISVDDEEIIHRLLSNHYRYTKSLPAKKVLDSFKSEAGKFIKVMPVEYRHIPDEKRAEKVTDKQSQASRCTDCGTPFCHWGCPIGNHIPEWNNLAAGGHWEKAFRVLAASNDLPEITGRLCPAHCEYACVLGINDEPVTIKKNELAIIEYAFEAGLVKPAPPPKRTGKRVAVIGSGPAGLICAVNLNKAGHNVVVFERDDKIGGILRYGIPDFKLEKWVLDRRLNVWEKEGVEFKTLVNVGTDFPASKLKSEFDAICLANGSRVPRNLEIEGRHLEGICFAMDYLSQSNKRDAGEKNLWGEPIDAKGKKVIIIGGGDTGADCVGTALRQGAEDVTQIELLPKPPEHRTQDHPWPAYPHILRTPTSYEEGGKRQWSVLTKRFIGENGHIKKISCVRVTTKETPGTEFELDADLVILAIGFVHPEHRGLLAETGVELDAYGNIKTNKEFATSKRGVFSAGDARRGQSLIAWAISEGRDAAHYIDAYLTASDKV